MTQPFTKLVTVHWKDCDVAGIVYYPRYFDMINVVTEDWFKEALGTSYADLMRTEHLGFPTVRIDCEFFLPCQYGENIEFSLTVAELGRSSLSLDFTGQIAGKPCLRANHTLVLMSKDTFSAVPIPPDLRARIEPYLKTAAVHGGK